MDNMTAMVSCFARAYHHKHKQVHVFDDTAAQLLLGADYAEIARSMTDGISFFLPGFQGPPEEGLRQITDGVLSPSVLGRSAFCEKMLENEKRLGCRQYVLFAAGYDSYALRNGDPALSVFELDKPELLADKKSRIKKAGKEAAAEYVPCDLEKEEWADKLAASGFQPGERAFGSLLGLSYYLEPEAFAGLLRTAAGLMPEGSVICFDYPVEGAHPAADRTRMLARGAGETMQAQYSEKTLTLLLQDCGFLICEHLEPAEMTAQYFARYNRRYPLQPMQAPGGVAYVLAVRK